MKCPPSELMDILEFKRIYLEIINKYSFNIHEAYIQGGDNVKDLYHVIWMEIFDEISDLKLYTNYPKNIDDHMVEAGEIITPLGDTIELKLLIPQTSKKYYDLYINNTRYEL